MRLKLICQLIGALITLSLTSCDSSESDFQGAIQQNTEQALKAFIERHPNSALVSRATSQMEQLHDLHIKELWETTKASPSPETVREFLREFGNSRFQSEAQALLETLWRERWKQIELSMNLQEYRNFLYSDPPIALAVLANWMAKVIYRATEMKAQKIILTDATISSVTQKEIAFRNNEPLVFTDVIWPAGMGTNCSRTSLLYNDTELFKDNLVKVIWITPYNMPIAVYIPLTSRTNVMEIPAVSDELGPYKCTTRAAKKGDISSYGIIKP